MSMPREELRSNSMERLTPAQRSYLMSQVHSRDTGPELAVRRIAHALGFRFRLHRSDLPGRPDLTFPRLRKIVMVHGCFWHRHAGCPRATTPATRTEYWQAKFDRTVERDLAAIRHLQHDGWRVLVVWECEIRDRDELRARLQRFLGS